MQQGIREFLISDEGDAFHLSLVENNVQIGGAFFPVCLEQPDQAFGLAWSLGQSFVRNEEAPFAGGF